MSYEPSRQQNYQPNNETNARWGTANEYNSAPTGAQTGTDWNTGHGPRHNQAAQGHHHDLGAATGPHFGNYTGAQGNPTQQNYPPHVPGGGGQSEFASGPYGGAPQSGPQTAGFEHTGGRPAEVMGAAANVGPGMMTSGTTHGAGAGAGAGGFGRGPGAQQVDPTYGNNRHGMGTTGQGKGGSSGVSRFIGEAEKIAGELTNNPTLVQKGEARKMGGTSSAMGSGPTTGQRRF